MMEIYKEFFANGKRRVVSSKEQLLKYINANNGYYCCYETTYAYTALNPEMKQRPTPDYSTAIINKVFFDFDPDEDTEATPYQEMLKTHEYFLKKGHRHTIRFSGRGYHIFVMVENKPYMNKKGALMNFSRHTRDNVGIHPDENIFGDIARIRRCLNTINMKACAKHKYCIPVSDPYMGGEAIAELAKRQCFDSMVFGKNSVDLSKFDYEPQASSIKTVLNGNTNFGSEVLDELTPCVKNIAANPSPRHMERVILVAELSDLLRCGAEVDNGEMVERVLPILESLGWKDFNSKKSRYQVEYTIKRCPFPFYCESKKKHGVCIGCGRNE